ncbi:hypothetical protein [Nocardia colli]|uniref:hypothetical protein n=1 Tax=Nocardia colli TaxID=2545717 RepID=UPI0035DFBCAE
MTDTKTPDEPTDRKHGLFGAIPPPNGRVGAHLVAATLDAVNELVSELLETAEQHKTVQPEISSQMAILAITVMEQTKSWLRQVTSA